MEKIDITLWKEFKVKDLFDIHPTKAYKTINYELLEIDGINPVVGNSSYNNGIVGYTNKDNTESGGIITFSDTTTANAIFFQPKDFVGYPHIQGMYPKIYKDKWNEYSMRFFATVFKKKALTLNINYVNKFTRKDANNIIIKLPHNSGEPDWDYMEKYIKEIDIKTNKILNGLMTIIKY